MAGKAGAPSTHPYASLPPDGQWPNSGLILDSAGNLYGTISRGGAYCIGTVSRSRPLAPSPSSTPYKLRTGIDGQGPSAGQILVTDRASLTV
jgi:hypothetical protein